MGTVALGKGCSLPGDVAVGRAGPAAVCGGLPAPGAALALAAVALVAALPAAVVGVAPVIVLIVVVKVAGHLSWMEMIALACFYFINNL